MLQFDKDFFLGETYQGFYVEPMMKCVWAAQLEVLEVIRGICEKHKIKYFAAYGTLLGAVRHKGFIPWDDDVDIMMLREDYERFMKLAPAEFTGDYHLQSPYNLEDYSTTFMRVTNTWTISYAPQQLLEFHGCPYIVGVDIFPFDTLPLNHAQEMDQAQLVQILMGTSSNCETDPDGVLEVLPDLEALCHTKFDRSQKLRGQLLKQADIISKKYSNTNGPFVTHIPGNPNANYHFQKKWFDECIYLPFENITLPAPKAYDAVLTKVYGEDYMTPICSVSHEYPFYKKQIEALEKSLVERIMRGEKLI